MRDATAAHWRCVAQFTSLSASLSDSIIVGGGGGGSSTFLPNKPIFVPAFDGLDATFTRPRRRRRRCGRERVYASRE